MIFNKSMAFVAITVALATLVTTPSSAETGGGLDCWTFPIDRVGPDVVEVHRGAAPMWLEMDDVFVTCGDASALGVWSSAEGAVARSPLRRRADLPREFLFIVRAAHPGGEKLAGLRVLERGGPYALVEALTEDARRAMLAGHWLDPHVDGDGCHRPWVRPFDGPRVLARQAANAQRGGTVFGPGAADAAAAVDFGRWFGDVETLAGWNRYTRGTEIAAASAWLVGQFQGLGLPVETPTFQVGSTTANNVIATWTGTSRPDDWYLIGAHYDSISQDPFNAAPGAEDNASGCAGVVELARVLVPRQPEATVIFLCYSGEEQGLFGSNDHAGGIVSAGDFSKVKGVLTMDMIGYSGDPDLDILLETEPEFESVLAPYADAAAEFTTLRAVTSLNAFGSDHVPYLNRDMPALLTIENDWDSYPGYHRTNDLPTNISQQMGGQTLQMNAAVMAQQTGAGVGGAIFNDGFESADTSAWSAAFP
ncbi:MAG: M28 family peptidase [Acidobacteriota bacterium]